MQASLPLPPRFTTLRRTPEAEATIAFLSLPASIEQMETATRLGLPALAGLDESKFPSPVRQALKDGSDTFVFRQFFGTVVGAILSELGYEPKKSNVRIKSQYFQAATVFQRSPDEDGETLLEKIRNDVRKYANLTGTSQREIIEQIFSIAPAQI